MKPNAAIEEACNKFIEAVIRAKDRSANDEAFWRDGRVKKRYEGLCKAIEANVPAGLNWWYTIWNLTGLTAEEILVGDFDPATGNQRFYDYVIGLLDALEGQDWIASVPMEFAFRRFPEFTDFGGFYLINPKGSDPDQYSLEDLLKRFQSILTQKVNVKFCPKDEVRESYLDLADHFFNKSGGYIPGRPQMVIKAGRGDEFINKGLLSALAINNFSLLSLCQIAYEIESDFESRVTGWADCRLPTGEQMQAGFIEVPSVAVAINMNTGKSSWWGVQHQAYETAHGQGYDPDKFMAIWINIATPLIGIQQHGMSGTLTDPLRNAVWLVAKCRHAVMGDLILNSVIATETILNPFNKIGTAESFALFAAALTSSTPEERIATYNTAKRLYNIRNHAVHQSSLHEEKGQTEPGQEAFGLFRACLKGVVKWIEETHSQGHECNEDEFRKFYLRTVLSPAGPKT